MRCSETSKLLPAYQDGRLTQKENEDIGGHLRSCPACREEGRALAEAWEMLKALEPPELSRDFPARFQRRVRQEEAAQPGWRAGAVRSLEGFAVAARPVFALASVLVVSVLGVWIALEVVAPQGAAGAGKSPLLQWAQAAPADLMEGGL